MKIPSKLAKLSATGICAFHLLLPASAAAQTIEINFATAYGPENFHTQNLQQFADDVAKDTAGRVRMKIHPNGSLIKPAAIYSGVREGKAEAGEVIMSGLAKEHPLFGMDALPFIVSGYADARHMWEVSRPTIEKVMATHGLQLLYAVPWPPQNLYSTRPLNNTQNFKGLTMRACNPATTRIAELIGAKPVTIQSVDLASAIAAGGLDVMITSSPTGVETKAWSKMQYYYKVNAWIPKNIVFISKKAFSGLDEETRRKVLAAARVAEHRGWKLSQDNDAEFEKQLVANKITVANLDPYLRVYLDRMGESLAREWLKQAGKEELMILLKYTTDRSMK